MFLSLCYIVPWLLAFDVCYYPWVQGVQGAVTYASGFNLVAASSWKSSLTHNTAPGHIIRESEDTERFKLILNKHTFLSVHIQQ